MNPRETVYCLGCGAELVNRGAACDCTTNERVVATILEEDEPKAEDVYAWKDPPE